MKTRIFSVLGLASFMLLASCSKDQNNDNLINDENKQASMTITVGGDSESRTRAVGFPTQMEENSVHDYTVFVFNANTNKLQKKQSFTVGLTNTVTGLTIGPKKVVVISNIANYTVLDLQEGDDYSQINDPANMLDIETQVNSDLATTGLVMSGEADITLSAGHNVMPTPLTISRIVAKVKLGTVAVNPEPGHNGVFTLSYVHIMKAKGQATLGAGAVLTGSDYYGGVLGTVSMPKPFYASYATIGDNAGTYYYVYPNDNTNDNATLITLEGTYDGRQVFFPIRINDAVGTGGSTTNGQYITRNSSYLVNVVIKRPGDGSENPEVPVDPATLELTVEVEDWATELVQNVEI